MRDGSYGHDTQARFYGQREGTPVGEADLRGIIASRATTVGTSNGDGVGSGTVRRADEFGRGSENIGSDRPFRAADACVPAKSLRRQCGSVVGDTGDNGDTYP